MQPETTVKALLQAELLAWKAGWNEAKWKEVFQDYPAQSEFTVHTNLRITSEREAYIKFQKRDLRWINPIQDRSAVLVIPTSSREAYREEDYTLAQAFLNHATFKTDHRAAIVGMSSYMRRINPLLMPVKDLQVNWHEDRFSSEASAVPEKLELALGLYREGINSLPISPFLAFLSFYRVLELAVLPLHKDGKGGSALAEWINTNAECISGSNRLAVSKTNQLKSGQLTLGKYFYTQCRCAIAHTQHEPIANPNLSEDYQRISNDMWVMQGLAKFAIGSKLGVLSQV